MASPASSPSVSPTGCRARSAVALPTSSILNSRAEFLARYHPGSTPVGASTTKLKTRYVLGCVPLGASATTLRATTLARGLYAGDVLRGRGRLGLRRSRSGSNWDGRRDGGL